MANSPTFKEIHDIPMDKMTFDKLSDLLPAAFPRENNYKLLKKTSVRVDYDEELQIASFSQYTPFSIEQGSEYFIITISDDFNTLPKCYLINKRTGDIYRKAFDQIPYNDLINGLMRVYNRSENELLELDYISDELKKEIEYQRRLREFEEAWTNYDDDSDDDGYIDVFSR